MSQLTLSLMVALLTSLSLFLPIIGAAVKTNNSKTDVRLIGGAPDGIRVFLTNSGWRPSIVTEAYMDIEGIYPDLGDYQVRLDESLSFSPIAAQSTVPALLHPDTKTVVPNGAHLDEGCCEVNVAVEEFDGKVITHSFKYRCDYFIDFFTQWLGHHGGVAATAPQACPVTAARPRPRRAASDVAQ